jgi:putative DNA primase/helicase
MAEAGLDCDTIVADGRFHRFRAPGESNGKKAGWYILYQNGGPAAGAFGDHRSGNSVPWHERWSAPRGKDAAEKRAELKRQADEAKQKRDDEIRRLQDTVADRAQKFWPRLKPAKPNHPYLITKKIKPNCARAYYGSLVLPVHDVRSGQLTTLQFIHADGQKKFLKGSRKKGCAIFLAADGADGRTIVEAEGFATAATGLEAAGCHAVAALDKDNLEAVAVALRDTRKDAQLIIAADNDCESDGNPGVRAAYNAARKVKALVAIPHFSDSPDRKCDFNDLGIAEGLDAVREQLAAAAPAIPLINADSDDLPAVNKSCWLALQVINHPERLFSFGNLPIRIKFNDDGQPITEELSEPRMRYELARAAEWFKIDRLSRQQLPGKPARDHVQDVLATPHLPLPVLRRITDVPTFSGKGELIDKPGFHPASGILYVNAALAIPEVPSKPSTEQLAAANKWIDDLLCDFPFAEDSDRAHAKGLLVLPFVRDLIDGPTPLHRVEATVPGSGKGLLADNLLSVSFNATRIKSMPDLGDNDDEWRKQITTGMLGGFGAVKIDNVKKPMTSGILAKALTDYIWTDRVLGQSRDLVFAIRWVWVVTLNQGGVIDDDMMRRSPRIRLAPLTEHPELRRGFTHPLPKWAVDNRPCLIWSALTLVQNWLVKDRPAPPHSITLGSYDNWAQVVGDLTDCGIGTGECVNGKWTGRYVSRGPKHEAAHRSFYNVDLEHLARVMEWLKPWPRTRRINPHAPGSYGRAS